MRRLNRLPVAEVTGDARSVGLYGFGASAHIVAQVAVCQGREVYAFTKPGDEEGQEFARSLGAAWAGGSNERPPAEMDAAIIFAPVGALVPTALKSICKGGTVVCAGIHMSDIPSFPYDILWGERVVRSVANLTRQDGDELLRLRRRSQSRLTSKLILSPKRIGRLPTFGRAKSSVRRCWWCDGGFAPEPRPRALPLEPARSRVAPAESGDGGLW